MRSYYRQEHGGKSLVCEGRSPVGDDRRLHGRAAASATKAGFCRIAFTGWTAAGCVRPAGRGQLPAIRGGLTGCPRGPRLNQPSAALQVRRRAELVDLSPARWSTKVSRTSEITNRGTSTTNVMLARKPEDELPPPGMTGPGPDRTHPASLRRT